MAEPRLRRSLASVVVPGELEARRRSWTIVRSVFDDRERVPRPIARRWPVLAAAAAVAAAAAAVTPPGRAVLGDVRDAIGRDRVVGIKRAAPSLFSLPAQGHLLVVSTRGPWVISPDGSKRLLGAYREASWSPFGRFVVASNPNELDALEPGGRVHWSLSRPGVRAARWGGTLTDTRIAYLSGDALHVVAGDGTGDRVLVPKAAPVAPAWEPGGGHVLAYVTPGGAARIIDADSGHITGGWREGSPEQLAFSADGKLVAARSARLLSIFTAQALRVTGITGRNRGGLTLGRDRFVDAAWAPTLPTLAYVTYDPQADRSSVWTVDRGGRGSEHQLFSGSGRISGVAWSPDGRWLLVAWDSADQWVFVRTGDAAKKVVAQSSISEQLNGRPGGRFPVVAGWCCA